MTISVLVVQDHTTTLEGWRVLLEAENGRTAVDLVRGGPPDVVVMECVLPELNGVPATRQNTGLKPPGSGWLACPCTTTASWAK